MYEGDFIFADAQDLSTLDSTGEISDYYWNLEDSASGSALNQTDLMVSGWLNIVILATTNTGGDEGLDVALQAASNTALTTNPMVLAAVRIPQDEIVAGNVFCVGACRAKVEQYLGVWFKAASTSLTGATTVDVYFSDQPQLHSPSDNTQKRSNSSFG